MFSMRQQSSSSSSDIKLKHYSHFKPSEAQIKETPLYDNIPPDLLADPEINIDSHGPPRYIFDSVVIDQDLYNQKIELERTNNDLKMRIQSLKNFISETNAILKKHKIQEKIRGECQKFIDEIYSKFEINVSTVAENGRHVKITDEQKQTRKVAIKLAMQYAKEKTIQYKKQKQIMRQQIEEADRKRRYLQKKLKNCREEVEDDMKKRVFDARDAEKQKLVQYNQLLYQKIQKMELELAKLQG